MHTVRRTLRRPVHSLSGACALGLAALFACTDEPLDDVRLERPARLARDLARAKDDVEWARDRAGSAELLAAVRAAWEEYGRETPYAPTRDGWLRSGLLDAYLRWNTPGEGRALPFAADVEREGHPARTIARYGAALAEHGIDLIVVPVPSRLQVHPELLCDLEPGDDFRGLDPGHFAFVLELAEAGVEVLDLLPDFARARAADLFLRFDHHWSPAGAELAADLLAARLGECPWFERGPLREGEDFVVRSGTLDYLPELPPGERKEPRVESLRVRRVQDKGGRPALAPERTSPVLLIGDSHVDFLAGEGLDLARQLGARIGRAVDTIVLPAGATEGVWRALRRRGDGLAGKRVVVWILSTGRIPTGTWAFIDPFSD